MRHLIILSASIVHFWSFAWSGSVVAQPSITNLGTLPDGIWSEARAVSADGSVVVGTCSTIIGARAFRWTSAGGMQDLGTLPGGTDSYAYGVSDDGSTVVGDSIFNSPTTSGDYSAFRWTSADGMEDLGTLPGGTQTEAYGVSGDGSAVVGRSESPGSVRAYRWTATGGMQDLGTLPGGYVDNSEAHAVNGDGSVVVGISNSADGARAFRWTAAGGMQNLGTLPDGSNSLAEAVSSDGSTIVGVSVGNTGGRAFRWTAANGMQDLGTFPDGYDLGAIDVSGDGSIIVGARNTPDDGPRAALWTAALGMVDLNVYLPTLGVDLSGWNLRYATGISADGSTIVGIGRFNETERGWLVSLVPEPSCIALLFCAAGILCARRRPSFAPTPRKVVPILPLFGLVASFSATTAASAAPLTFSFTDPGGDASGSSYVDVLNLEFNFDNTTGDFEARVTGRPRCCRSFDQMSLKLFNADVGSTAQDPAFFNHFWSVRWYEPDGTTVVTVTGSEPILRTWNAGDRVATSDIPFGNPDGVSDFQSNVRTFLAVQQHGPPQLLGYDDIAPSEIATIQSAQPLLGDFNGNGAVDAADYVVWRKTSVSPDDYNDWRANFGATLGSGSSQFATLPLSSAIPEPTSALLFLSCAAIGYVGTAGRFRRPQFTAAKCAVDLRAFSGLQRVAFVTNVEPSWDYIGSVSRGGRNPTGCRNQTLRLLYSTPR